MIDATSAQSKVARIRAQVRHPVIDADGHTIEVTPVLLDHVKTVGGAAGLREFTEYLPRLFARCTEEGRGNWHMQPTHWTYPASTLDRATGALPRLYHERLDEIGLDFSLVYPTIGIMFQMLRDEDVRRTSCRALNLYMSEVHAGLGDRILPVGTIPMHTPEEAITELEHVVEVLGMRAVMIPSFVKRPLAQVRDLDADLGDVAFRIDTYGVDSDHDYDPFWARCEELAVVPGVHTPTWGLHLHESVSNYVFTHVGMFGAGAEAFCRSLLLGGVFHRFPRLKVAALEGGVGWAVTLYAHLLGHWEKRHAGVIGQFDPARLDREEMASLVDEYGSEALRSHGERVLEDIVDAAVRRVPPNLDDFRASPFESAEDFRDLFTSRIYVGCEADDPLTALAFDAQKNALGARFRVLLGSDIGHWDVPDVANVLVEAYELVERGLLDERDFEEFTFSNPVRLYAGTNPHFFAGTRVESAVADWLAQTSRT